MIMLYLQYLPNQPLKKTPGLMKCRKLWLSSLRSNPSWANKPETHEFFCLQVTILFGLNET